MSFTGTLQSDSQHWAVYQKSWVSISMALMMILGCVLLGWAFVVKVQEYGVSPPSLGYAIAGFGYLVFVIATILILSIPRFLSLLIRQGGSLQFEINRKGIIKPGNSQMFNGFPFRTNPPLYPWKDIAHIVLSDKVERHFTIGRPQYFSHAVLIVLQNQKKFSRAEQEYYNIFTWPDGEFFVVAGYHADNLKSLMQAVEKFSDGKITAQYHPTVMIDDKNDTIVYGKNE